MDNGIREHWLSFVLNVLLRYPTYQMSSTGRKYVSNVGFKIPGEDWLKGFDINATDLGYASHSTKMKQLMRNYYNEEEIAKAQEKLAERIAQKMDFTSIAMPLSNQAKRKSSQGHCMNSCIIAYTPKDYASKQPNLSFTIFYRITEVVQKFAADLIFLNKIVLPELMKAIPQEGLKINSVSFQFANAYFSPLFLPILFPFVNPVEMLIKLEETGEQHLIKSCYRAAKLPLIEKDPEHYNYRTRRIMHNVALKNLSPEEAERLLIYFKERGEI